MSAVKCRTCFEPLDSTWLFCECCGKKTNKSDIDLETNVQHEIARKSQEDLILKRSLEAQASKVERIPACDIQINIKPEIDPKTTLIKARALAAKNARILDSGDPQCINPNKVIGDSIASTVNETDEQTKKMTSFLEEFNHSMMQKSVQQATHTKKSAHKTKKKSKANNMKKNKNIHSPNFFKSALDVKTSQNFNVITSSEKYLDHIPSLLDIFDDPSLLPKEENVDTEQNNTSIIEAETDTGNTDASNNEEPDSCPPEEKVFFWGAVTQDIDDEGTTLPQPEDQGERLEEQGLQPASWEKSVRDMKLFQGGFWGDQGPSHENEEERGNRPEGSDDNDNENDDDGKLFIDAEDDQSQRTDANSGIGGRITEQMDDKGEEGVEDGESQGGSFIAISDDTEIGTIFEQLKVKLSGFSNEKGRRYIANLYRSSMKHMNNAISKGTIVFSQDPIKQSRPVTLYKRLEHQLKNAVNEGDMCIRAIDELYRMCHEDSKQRRLDIVACLDAENKRAAAVRHKYSVKYANITNKEGIDVYTLEGAQNRIREKAEKELDVIRMRVNDLLKQETDLIMKIKSEERSLELTVVMYSTKHLRLLEQTRVTLQSIISAKRWLAVRVIQRNVRFFMLPLSIFGLQHVATPWFRRLLRQQADMLREEELAKSPLKINRVDSRKSIPHSFKAINRLNSM